MSTLRLRRPFSPESILLGIAAAVILAIFALSVIVLHHQYTYELADAHRTARNFSGVLSEHTSRTLEAVGHTLREADIILRDLDKGRYKSVDEANESLRLLQQSSPIIVSIGWTDGNGNVRANSYGGSPLGPTLGNPSPFQDGASSDPAEVELAPSFISPATGRWMSALSRPMRKQDGSFGGVVTVSLDLSYFTRIYGSIELGEHGAVSLMHRTSGSLLVREPLPMGGLDTVFSRDEIFLEKLAKSDSGTYEAVGRFDGRPRVLGYRAVSGFPVVIVVSLAREDILRAVLDDGLRILPLVLFIVLVVIAGTIFQIRLLRAVDGKSRLLTVTLENIDQGLVMVAPDGSIPVYNQRALQLLDLPAEIIASRSSGAQILPHLYKRDEGAPTTVRILEAPEGDSPSSYKLQRADGTQLEIRTFRLPDGGVVQTYSDITRRVEARQALEREKERAEAAARAKSDFLATMSHELRTPLTAIIGFTEVLLAEIHSDEQRRYYLDMQREAGRGLLAIINDILDFSRLEAGRVEIEVQPVDVADLVLSSTAMIAAQAEAKELAVSIDMDRRVPRRVLGDAPRLRQVLLNLLSNAVKFTHKGSVRVSVESMDRPLDALRFCVADTGIGIHRSQLDRLFERFTQGDGSTSRSFGGTGLGLAISKGLVELMGGRLDVESAPGKGTRFSFVLVMPPPADETRQARETDLPGARTRRAVLLAEDNAMNRELIAEMLTRAGHSVTSVATGTQAVEAVRKGSFDILLMDIQMPEMDGYEATRLIRAASETDRSIPIVALTANALPEEQRRCREAGMNAHVAKPVDWPHLLQVIDALAGGAGDAPYSSGLDRCDSFEHSRLELLHRRIGADGVARLLKLFRAEARAAFRTAPHDPALLKAVAEEAHSLAGAAAMLGFAALARACLDLEAAIGEKRDAAEAFERCLALREAAFVKIEELLQFRESPSSSPPGVGWGA